MAQAPMETLPDDTVEIEKLRAAVESLEQQVKGLEGRLPEDKVAMVVMSGDLDKLLAAFIIATGAAAMYEQVSMFFTFWAIPALKDPRKTVRKTVVGKLFEYMLPRGAGALSLSRMNMAGAGKAMVKRLMKQQRVMSLEELIQMAAESGVRIYVCQMSMDLMGYALSEMIDYPGMKAAGVATFLAEAGTSKVSLFI
jgi:peroxiredoxin family protein